MSCLSFLSQKVLMFDHILAVVEFGLISDVKVCSAIFFYSFKCFLNRALVFLKCIIFSLVIHRFS